MKSLNIPTGCGEEDDTILESEGTVPSEPLHLSLRPLLYPSGPSLGATTLILPCSALCPYDLSLFVSLLSSLCPCTVIVNINPQTRALLIGRYRLPNLDILVYGPAQPHTPYLHILCLLCALPACITLSSFVPFLISSFNYTGFSCP